MERSSILKWILFGLSILLIVAAFLFYQHIISYLIVAFLIAYIISPLVNLAEKYQIKRTVSILVIYIIIALLLAIFFNVIIPQIIEQMIDLVHSLNEVVQEHDDINLRVLGFDGIANIIDSIESRFPQLEIHRQISFTLDEAKFNSVLNQIPLFFKSVINVASFLIVVPVIVFFILKDERKFFHYIFSCIGNRYFEFSLHLFEKIETSFGRFFRALLLETLLVTIMSIAGLLILRIPYAIVLGLIVGLANPIKYFGPFIGAVPTLLIILLGPTPDIYILYAGIMFLIVQQIDSLILFPWLVGKSMNMHPLWVLLTVIAGGYAFGILGMLFAVPVVFLIKVIVEVSHKSLKKFEII
jgi:predicted PurR-regulated permease PerM